MARKEPASPVLELVDRLRSAIKTGRKVHLELEQAMVLMEEPVYLALSRLEARELRRLSAAEVDSGNRSVSSGFGSGPSFSPGRSAGLSVTALDAVSRGASQLLREEVALTLRRKKRSTP
jgi:hypothetical protein